MHFAFSALFYPACIARTVGVDGRTGVLDGIVTVDGVCEEVGGRDIKVGGVHLRAAQLVVGRGVVVGKLGGTRTHAVEFACRRSHDHAFHDKLGASRIGKVNEAVVDAEVVEGDVLYLEMYGAVGCTHVHEVTPSETCILLISATTESTVLDDEAVYLVVGSHRVLGGRTEGEGAV